MAHITLEQIRAVLAECVKPQSDDEYRVRVEELIRLVDVYHRQVNALA